MKKKKWLQSIPSIVLTITLLALNPAVFARDKKAEEQSGSIQSVQPEVTAEAQDKISEKRKKIIREAVAAIDKTEKALLAVEKKKTDEVLAALERVTGKLEVILPREPQLALAPLKVSVVTNE